MAPLEEDSITPSSSGAHAKRNKRKKELARLRKEEAKTKEHNGDAIATKMSNSELLDALLKEIAKIKLKEETEKKNNVLLSATVLAETVYEIKLAPGKGLGIFAIKDIAKGTEILREAPLFRGGRPWLSKEAAFAVLSDDKKQRFLALRSRCNCGKIPCMETVVMKIWDCNSFETSTSLQTGYNCVYEIASRMNHSCLPNTSRKFTKDSNIVFAAVENIKKGDEITTDYGGRCGSTSFRREFFSKRYGFLCHCRACTANKTLPYNAIIKKMQESKVMGDGNGTAILNKPTAREVAAEEEVVKWLKSLTTHSTLVQLILLEWMTNTMEPDTPADEKCKTVAAASMMAWEECLKGQNKFGLSDDVLDKYHLRLSKILFGALETQNDPETALDLFFAHIRGTIVY